MSNSVTTVTHGVRVTVEPEFSPERSDRGRQLWFFLYTVTIANEGTEPLRLVTRHWIITDAMGEQEEVRGPGVVGEQPLLAPGESFEYTSGCPLRTPFGSMVGSYQMLREDGTGVDVAIPAFSLREPNSMH